MTDHAALLQQRLDRLDRAIALEKTDRAPVILMTDSFSAACTKTPLSKMCGPLNDSYEVIKDSLAFFPEADGVEYPIAPATLFPLVYMSKMRYPGRELPENTSWQVAEAEVMTVEDYDTILKGGWGPFMVDYMKTRLDIDIFPLLAQTEQGPSWVQGIEAQGKYVFSPFTVVGVPELLAGGRSFPRFMMDLKRIPDKVEAVLDVITEETIPIIQHMVRASKAKVVFFGPGRGASDFFSPKLWERFIWKYTKKIADALLEAGTAVDFHIDSNWERDLSYFRDFPAKRCIFETDGYTDLYKVKEVLGDMMARKGDVNPTMLALGTPDQVYNYCTNLIKDMGPGFILSSGCSIPFNAKFENVKAMVAAAAGN